ncbi:hypothetical protein [Hymenobacter oligotrophus]|nr:hypothetical protein [Hymenobacter oligotrophus]
MIRTSGTYYAISKSSGADIRAYGGSEMVLSSIYPRSLGAAVLISDKN